MPTAQDYIMDDMMTQALVRAPELVVLVLVVMLFLRYLSKRDAVISQIADECHKVQGSAVDAIRDNSSALGKNSEAYHHVSRMLEKCIEQLHRTEATNKRQ